MISHYNSDHCVCIDGCPEESTTIVYDMGPNITAFWNESDIGTVTQLCPCGNISEILNATTTRVCRGDFINPANWLDPNVEQCQMLDPNICILSMVRFVATSHKIKKT